MVAPDTATVPADAVVEPAAVAAVEGADQPDGTVRSTSPFDVPPGAAA